MSRDQRILHRDGAGVLLRVAPQMHTPRRGGAPCRRSARDGQLAQLELAWSGLHDRATGAGGIAGCYSTDAGASAQPDRSLDAPSTWGGGPGPARATPRSAGRAGEHLRGAGRVPHRGARPRAPRGRHRLPADGGAVPPRERPGSRGGHRALRRCGPGQRKRIALPARRRRRGVPHVRAGRRHGAAADPPCPRRSARRAPALRSGAGPRPASIGVRARRQRPVRHARTLARVPVPAGSRVARAARHRAARGDDGGGALPVRRPRHPRVPRRGDCYR